MFVKVVADIFTFKNREEKLHLIQSFNDSRFEKSLKARLKLGPDLVVEDT
jgi:hypothetical protein